MFLSQERLSAFIARDDSIADSNHYDTNFDEFSSRQVFFSLNLISFFLKLSLFLISL